MKKVKNGIFIMAFAIIMPITSICVNALTHVESDTLDYRVINTMKKISDENDTCIEYEDEQNQLIINEIFDTFIEQSINAYSDNTEQNLFPSNYAGSYYSFSDSKLYMCRTDDNMDDFYNTFFENNLIEFSTVDYSVFYLESILDEITEDVFATLDMEHASLNIENNCILIKITNLEKKEKIDEYFSLKGYDIQAIKYQIVPEMEAISTSSYNESGRKIYGKNASSNPGTIGCNALRVYNGKSYRGIITCAHVIDNYPNVKWDVVTDTSGNKTELLDPTSNALISKNNTLVDAVFVPYSDQSIENTPYIWNYHGKTIYQGKIVSYSTSLSNYENQIVTKYGVSGELSGKLSELTSVGTIGGQYRTDFFKIEAHSFFGDSGGPVGIKSTSNGNTYLNILGFTTAMERSTGSDASSGPAYCDKIANVKSELGIIPVSGNRYPY